MHSTTPSDNNTISNSNNNNMISKSNNNNTISIMSSENISSVDIDIEQRAERASSSPYSWSCSCGDLVLAVPRMGVSTDRQSLYCCNRLFALPYFARTRVFVVCVLYVLVACAACVTALLLHVTHEHITLQHFMDHRQPDMLMHRDVYASTCIYNYTQKAHEITHAVMDVRRHITDYIKTMQLPPCVGVKPQIEMLSFPQWTVHLWSMGLLIGAHPLLQYDMSALFLTVYVLIGIPLCIYTVIRASSCLLRLLAFIYLKDWLPGKAIDMRTANDEFPRVRPSRRRETVDLPYLVIIVLLVLVISLTPLLFMWLEQCSYAFGLFYLLMHAWRVGFHASSRLGVRTEALTVLFVTFVWLLLWAGVRLIKLRSEKQYGLIMDQIIMSQTMIYRPHTSDLTASEQVYEKYLKKHTLLRMLLSEEHRSRLNNLQSQAWYANNAMTQTDLYSTVHCCTQTNNPELCDAIMQSNRVRAPVPPKAVVIIKQPTLFNYNSPYRYHDQTKK